MLIFNTLEFCKFLNPRNSDIRRKRNYIFILKRNWFANINPINILIFNALKFCEFLNSDNSGIRITGECLYGCNAGFPA